MRHTRWFASCAALLCIALGGCAAKGSQPGLDEVGNAELDDLIVPGRRVGPVSIGMSEAAMRQLMGQPLETHQTEDSRMYEFRQMSVVVPTNTRRVELVIVPAPFYKTLTGITVGDEEAKISAALGKPARQTGRGVYVTTCYANGLVFNYYNGTVENIVVRTPGC